MHNVIFVPHSKSRESFLTFCLFIHESRKVNPHKIIKNRVCELGFLSPRWFFNLTDGCYNVARGGESALRLVVGLADFHFHVFWRLHAWQIRTQPSPVSPGDVTAHGRVQDWPRRERLGTRLVRTDLTNTFWALKLLSSPQQRIIYYFKRRLPKIRLCFAG